MSFDELDEPFQSKGLLLIATVDISVESAGCFVMEEFVGELMNAFVDELAERLESGFADRGLIVTAFRHTDDCFASMRVNALEFLRSGLTDVGVVGFTSEEDA